MAQTTTARMKRARKDFFNRKRSKLTNLQTAIRKGEVREL